MAKLSKTDELKKKLEEIKVQFGGNQQNIPMNHPFWNLLSEYHQLIYNQNIKDRVEYEPVGTKK